MPLLQLAAHQCEEMMRVDLHALELDVQLSQYLEARRAGFDSVAYVHARVSRSAAWIGS
jgi:hypothetical protein